MTKKLTGDQRDRAKGNGSTSSRNRFLRMVKTFNRPSIISEGDSWFDYPKKLLSDKPSNIIDHVHNQTKGKVNLLRMESNGDEATEMLSGDQRHRLTEILFKSTEMGKQVDVLFFSAGGNDIVGDLGPRTFSRKIQTWDGAEGLHQPRNL